MNSLAIITARGGSKRIPRKNIRPFLGKPILLYSIEAALQSGVFSQVMVSTDDEEIAAVARSGGALVPFLRSSQTSDDYATTVDVLLEVLRGYEGQGQTPETACCLYPTAPFITAPRLRAAYERLQQSGAPSVIPVTRFSFPIWRSFRQDGQGRLSYIWPENAPKRSQDLEPAFHDVGQFYFFRVPEFMATSRLVTEDTLALEVSELEVQDIDNEVDWQIAELKYRLLYPASC